MRDRANLIASITKKCGKTLALSRGDGLYAMSLPSTASSNVDRRNPFHLPGFINNRLECFNPPIQLLNCLMHLYHRLKAKELSHLLEVGQILLLCNKPIFLN